MRFGKINIEWSNKHQAFYATSEEMPSINAYGRTEFKALQNFQANLVDGMNLKIDTLLVNVSMLTAQNERYREALESILNCYRPNGEDTEAHNIAHDALKGEE